MARTGFKGMWLVLCWPGDTAALWAAAGLKARGVAPLELVSPEELACAPQLTHQVGGAGARARATLARGLRLDSSEIAGTLNRFTAVTPPQLTRFPAADRAYVAAEWSATLLGWLSALAAPIYNPAVPQGLSGPWWPPLRWAVSAARAGLPVENWRCGWNGLEPPPLARAHQRQVIVLDGSCYPTGCLPTALVTGCRRLSQQSGVPLLGVSFRRDEGGRYVTTQITTTPDLRFGGADLVRALADRFLRP